MTKAWRLTDYDYDLPEQLIAQRPADNRDDSRLMLVRGRTGPCEISQFAKICDLLPKRSLIVANNSTVVPARLLGHKANLGRIELMLLTPLELLRSQVKDCGETKSVIASVLLRPSKSLKPGTKLYFPDLQATVVRKGGYGQCTVLLEWRNFELIELLTLHGMVPLPPYIKRDPDMEDKARYQTIYASDSQQGSVAAPTAGLHFSEQVKASLHNAGHDWCELTLFVGYGTFSPIRSQDIRDHVMHAEYVRISKQTARIIARAKQDKRPIIAVGTTTMRSLEGVFERTGCLEPFEGWLDTYIYPGFSFNVVQGLLTNFHLPRSSLLVLVSAFAGRERILSAYRKAVEEKMRFFSYGDAMFLDMS